MKKLKFGSLAPFILLILFFFSGVSALIYQTVWIRHFGLIFGVDIFAAATVLTAFMAGLALGNLIFGKLVDKRKNALLLYVWLELGVGLFALLFPFSFKALDALYVDLFRIVPMGFYATQLVRFLIAFLFLLIPTTLMGGTLPVLTKVLVKKLKSLGWNVGRLYSVNNLGAFVGCLLAGFFLMRSVGLQNSIFIAAGLNVLNAVAVFLVQPLFKSNQEQEHHEEQTDDADAGTAILPTAVVRFVLFAFAVEGFAALAYEVIWTRILLDFSYDKSVYFYTTVILSFIFGLSFGSILIAKVLDKKKDVLLLFAGIEAAIGISAILILTLFSRIAELLGSLRLAYSDNWWSSLGREYFIFFAAMIIPTTLMGMTFPVVSKICTPHVKRLGTRIGEIGFLDTIGSVFGAFAAGFILIPLLGVLKSVLLAAGINILIAVIAVIIHPRRPLRFKAWALGGTAALIVLSLITLPRHQYFQHWQTKRASDRLLYYHEGADATIAVPQHDDGVKFLAINGSVTAFANYGDTRVHKMLGFLPWLLQENPKTALVIGLGMGITAQSLMLPGMQAVDCVEINRGVVEAAAGYFAKENKSVLAENRLHMIIDDGRSYLHTTDKKYDLITSNAVHARLSGNLYTTEFYQICKERLNKNGVMCQWTSTNWLSPQEFKSLIAAFQSVFPHTSLWLVNAGHLLIIGTPEPLAFHYADLRKKFALARVRADLSDYALGDPDQFLAHFVCDEQMLPQFLQHAPLNRDDLPVAEFSRVVSKMQIPEILLGLIHIKQDLVDHLYFDKERLEEMTGIKRRVRDYADAEKYYLEGVFARNIYNQPLLALNMMTEALTLEPEDYRYHEEAASINLELAQSQARSDKELATFLDNAIEHLQAMTTAFPGFAFDWNNLGYIYMNRGRLQEAQSAFQKAVTLAPDLPLPRIYLASILGGRGHLDQAEKLLQTALDNFPDEIEAWYRLGLVYELMSRKKEARDAFENVVQRDKEYRDAAVHIRNLK